MAKRGAPRKELDYDDLAAAWVSELSTEEIAKLFAVSTKTLRTRVKEAGLTSRRRGSPVQDSTHERVAVIRRYLASGENGAQNRAARHLGISRQAVQQLRKKYIAP